MSKEHFIYESQKIFVSEVFLTSLGLSNQTLNNKIILKSWEAIKRPCGKMKIYYINYDSLSKKIVNDYKLPSKKNIVEQLGMKQLTIDTCDDQSKLLMQYKLFYDIAHSRYSKYNPFYYEQGYGPREIAKRAITHSILELTVNLIERDKARINDLFLVLKELDFPDLCISLVSVQYFYKIVRSARNKGIPKTLIHGLKNKSSNNEKLTVLVKKIIKYFARHQNNIPVRLIRDQTNTLILAVPRINGRRPISRQAINSYLNRPEIRNQIKSIRSSSKYFDMEILPYLNRIKPEHPLDLWEIDGTKIQYAHRDSSDKVSYTYIVYVMDGFSKVILGYALGKTETSELFVKAMEMAIIRSRYRLPKEIVTDGTSARLDQFKRVVGVTENLGVQYTIDKNPRRKARLERLIGTMQSVYLNPHFGYIGEGIRSKRENARPNREVLLLLRDKKYLKNEGQFQVMMDDLIAAYNNGHRGEANTSPNEDHKSQKPVNAIQLLEYHLPLMCWIKVTRKIMNCQFEVTVNGFNRKYQSYEWDSIGVHNGEYLDCYVNEDYIKEAYVFKKGTDHFLARVPIAQYAHAARINQTDKDVEIIKAHKNNIRRIKSQVRRENEKLEKDLKKELGALPDELLDYSLDSKQVQDDAEFRAIMGYKEEKEPKKVNLHKPLKDQTKKKKEKPESFLSGYSTIKSKSNPSFKRLE